MFGMVSVLVSMSSSSQVGIRSSFDLRVWYLPTPGGIFVIISFLSTFTYIHSHYVCVCMVTSNVDFADDWYVCHDVWPIFWDVENVGLRCTVWAFPCSSLPCFLL